MMLALYAGCFVLGGVFLAVSTLGFGKDVDHGDADHGDADHGDAGHAHDHDHDHAAPSSDTALIATLLSVRFWTFALAAFGLTGILLSLVGLPVLIHAPVALVMGGAIGGTAATLFRRAAHKPASSMVDLSRLAGREARVLLAVEAGKPGKIRIEVAGEILDLPATTREDARIERQSRVLVVEVKDGTADVTPVQPRPSPQSATH